MIESYTDANGVECCDNCSKPVEECACHCVGCGDHVSDCACDAGPAYPAVSE